MPQMSPTYWMFLMFYFVTMIVVMTVYIYFTVLMNLIFLNLCINKVNWMW